MKLFRKPRTVYVTAIEFRTIEKYGQRKGRCARVYATIWFPNGKTAKLVIDDETAKSLVRAR